MHSGVTDEAIEAMRITIINTAIFQIIERMSAMFDEAILLVDDEFHTNRLSILFETVATSFIFLIWMDVRIIPKKSRLDTFGTKSVNTINAAGGAASVHE